MSAKDELNKLYDELNKAWQDRAAFRALCPSCKRNDADLDLHGCPLQEEIHDDYEFQCACCQDCTVECADNI